MREMITQTPLWQKIVTNAFHSFPGLITAKGLVEDVFLQLDCQNLALASQVAKSILHTAFYQLQPCWINTQLRGLESFSQGPQWRSQVQRGRTLATQVRQKITGFVAIGQALLGPYVGTFRRLQ